jgi:hypothetical protein
MVYIGKMDNVINGNKLLDDLLKIVCEGGEAPRKMFIQTGEISDRYEQRHGNIDVHLLDSALQRLKADNLISDNMKLYGKGVSESTLYPITDAVEYENYNENEMWIALFDGFILVQNGGYKANAEKARNQKKIQNLRDWLLVLGSIAAAIGTIFLALTELVKHYVWNSQ